MLGPSGRVFWSLEEKQHDYYYLERDKLYFEGRICVPQSKTQEVAVFYHSHGHASGYKLLDIVLHRCEFEDPVVKVKEMCHKVAQGCHVCQAVKPCTTNYGTLDYFPVPNQIFSSLCMDFLSLSKLQARMAVFMILFLWWLTA